MNIVEDSSDLFCVGDALLDALFLLPPTTPDEPKLSIDEEYDFGVFSPLLSIWASDPPECADLKDSELVLFCQMPR